MKAPILVVGTYVQDLAFRCDRIPTLGESVLGTLAPAAGGKGFNQAVAAHRAGVPTLFVGAVGCDAFADNARAFGRAIGLRVQLVEKPGHATAAAAVLLDRIGQNQIVVALGAGARLRPADLDAAAIRAARVVMCQHETSPAVNAHVFRLAHQAGVTTVLNPAPMRADFTAAMLAHVDVLTPNETEFAALVRRLVPGQRHFTAAKLLALAPAALHALCRRLGVPVVIVTLGARGTLVSQAAGHTFIRAYRVRVVDTTGAGDAFNGGFAAGLVKFNGDVVAAARFGNAVAALSVMRPGAAPAMPTAREIARFLQGKGKAQPS
ncbi:MAG: ribokinase [Verrucomicrobiota bacterium]